MFTIDTLVDHGTSTTKQALAHIPNAEVRNGLETLVDAQAAYTKTVFSVASNFGKTAFDAVITAVSKPANVAKK